MRKALQGIARLRQSRLSDAKMEFMICDRLSWMQFPGFELAGDTPDESTIRHFRNRMTENRHSQVPQPG